MIDPKLIEEKSEYVKEALAKKGWDFDPKPLLADFQKRRDLLRKSKPPKRSKTSFPRAFLPSKKPVATSRKSSPRSKLGRWQQRQRSGARES
jgi:hypothetical protein